MRWLLIPFGTLAALTALMLWRDLKSGRVYESRVDQSYDPDDEFYETKAESPVWFRVKTSLAAVAALTGVTLGFFPAFVIIETTSGMLVMAFCCVIQFLYLMEGLIGRVSSWIKNYGSVDKKW